MQRRYITVDVFTDRAFGGNPLAVVLDAEGRSAEAIFGMPDCLKFHSSMTLFALSSPTEALFKLALDKYFHGQLDVNTVRGSERARGSRT